MSFFINRSSITIDCFTSDHLAFQLSKPDYAIKFMPDWWKKMPSYYTEKNNLYHSPTMKGCEGFKNSFLNGFMIPMWSDLILDVGPKGTNGYGWQFSDRESSIVIHPFKQMNSYLDETNIQHFKLTCPWSFKCNKDIKWVWTDPLWNRIHSNDYTILPGIVSFKFALQGNVNLFVYREEKSKLIKINFGQPVTHLVPMTEKKLKIKHHLVSEDEYKKLSILTKPVVFYRRYTTIKNLLK
jgi:hypothetical protein